MSADYVRQHYGVDYRVGDRLIIDGRIGTLVSFPDQYLGVRFDGETRTSRCHPTWRVEMATIPEWPRRRTTIVDAHSGKRVIGKRVIVETCRHGRKWGGTYFVSTEQITRARFDLLEEVEHRCIEKLAHEIEGRHRELTP